MTVQLSRRHFLRGLGGVGALAVAGLARPDRTRAHEGHLPEADALETSRLVYVSPLKSDDTESTCHAEVWFVKDGGDLVVVTEPSRWRAACIDKGLDRARLWVGDYGAWKESEGRYKSAPSFVARASIDADTEAHTRALAAFGKKYADSWEKWGPRFEKGLASGERVLIRYQPSL